MTGRRVAAAEGDRGQIKTGAYFEKLSGQVRLEFSAQYQQAPVPVGGNLIKWQWFKLYQFKPTPKPGDKLIVSWDTAQSSQQPADYSACVVLLVRKETVYVLDVVRARLEYPELKRAVS